ncbi:endospore germination permease [Paenibacillus allorhizosphaerae]|uniref:Spore germination protein YndE n=1 Tax=Paenibacillus allorhizosphaerae TaxID=2849866 RepID=A0ABM8VK20_9BACL|nr:endospore germination permease [Paenibacillus allorhizosphaerae]CAG7646379.1 Spore germination protein YndE [Paenibacillus allorhizosphaerae]
MKTFEYGDREISASELFFSVSSMILGIGILTLPRGLSKVVPSSDGWMSIVLAGLLSIGLVWILTQLTTRFPNETIVEFSVSLIGKHAAWCFSVLLFIAFFMFTGYEVRGAAEVAKQYLFSRTPVEVIGLAFFLVVIYAVCGTKVGVIRLNVLFFPFVLGVFLLVIFMNFGSIRSEHLQPVFVSNWKQVFGGIWESLFSFFGFEIVLFYSALLNRPTKSTKAAVLGVAVPMLLYVLVFLFVIGVFSPAATAELQYPTVELAKEIEVPGAVLERFESFFFTIWLMTLFNSAAMALDICTYVMCKLVGARHRLTVIFSLAPAIFLVSFIPRDLHEFGHFGRLTSLIDLFAGILIPCILYVVLRIKGGRRYGNN